MTTSEFETAYRTLGDPWKQTGRVSPAAKRRLRVLAALRPFYAGKRVLEAGCGLGVLTGMLASHAASVTAFDISPTAIARADKLGIANARFHVDAMPDFADYGRYDVVTLIECLYYLEAGAQAAVLERIKAAGPGRLIISAPVIGTLNGRRYYTEHEIMMLLRCHGFAIERIHVIGMLRPATALQQLLALVFKALYVSPIGGALDFVWDRLPSTWVYQKMFVCRY